MGGLEELHANVLVIMGQIVYNKLRIFRMKQQEHRKEWRASWKHYTKVLGVQAAQ